DEHLRGADFFDVAKYPFITFKSSHFEKAADGRLLAIGNLTIHGVTRPVTLTVDSIAPPSKALSGNTVRGASATGKLFRKDFGLVWNKTLETGGVAVGDEVELTIDVELVEETKAAANESRLCEFRRRRESENSERTRRWGERAGYAETQDAVRDAGSGSRD